MNILIGINHPKQVHMFRILYNEMYFKGHTCHVIVVQKDITCSLLDELGIPYKKIGKNHKNKLMKFLSLIPLSVKTFIYARRNSIDIFIGQALIHLGIAGFLTKKPFIILEDTENAIIPQFLANPFADTILTPDCFNKDFGEKQIRLNCTFEIAYLRYNWFKPEYNILKKLNINKDEIFTIVRFVQWTANHDIGHNGITDDNKIKLVEEFSNFGRVIISSEGKLPEKLKKYKVNINVSEMHHLLYFSRLLYGESASMAAEAAYLGTPSIYLDNEGRGYTDEIEKYNLIYNFSESQNDQIDSINKGKEILSSKDKEYWINNSQKLIHSYIDFGAFLNWFVENYPKSKIIMKENKDYQDKFK